MLRQARLVKSKNGGKFVQQLIYPPGRGVFYYDMSPKNPLHLFDEIMNGKMILNGAGKMVEQT